MSEPVKFTEEEMQQLSELQTEFNKIVVSFGQLHIDEMNLESAKIRLENVRERITDDYNKITAKEKELAEKLNTKYGAGVLDPATGIFTPSAQKQ